MTDIVDQILTVMAHDPFEICRDLDFSAMLGSGVTHVHRRKNRPRQGADSQTGKH
jgi:hypothetical protein